ncbi:MAG: uroporphyrinogen-III C-methyltransferase [Myxococcales bacterium]|nr:uroporphyrinogen-III C-methyltransferase [Myxococcales bacterium]MCB9753610.1 uroporphyrinogen-III C-methyltransferase [Myxococcales bacterium]
MSTPSSPRAPEAGFVSLVGAGPWDPELLTLAGRDRLARADVVIADYLVNPALLVHCRPDAEIIQRSRGPGSRGGIGPSLRQDAINELLAERASRGLRVVRLKGGDPMVFGRGSEEAEHLRARGIAYEFVPGVSAAIAAPEAAGIPITQRHHTPSVSFISGYEAYEKSGRAVGWEHMARHGGTLVIMMSVRNCRENAERLIAAGKDPGTPAALIRWGTRGVQRTVVAPLAQIADRAEEQGLRPPAVLVVGSVVELRSRIQWFEQRPLFGRRVVVTRAAHQAGELLHQLAARGADAVAFPCLAVAPPEDPEAVTRAARALDEHDGVILSSPNGVRAWFKGLIEGAGLDARALAGKRVAAIGTGTARACLAHGVRPDIVPARARAEGLIDTLRARDLLRARWLHVRADTGRSLLGAAIEAAGGRYTLAIGYRTVRPQVSPVLLSSLRPPSHGNSHEGVDAVCFASGKTARHFLEALDEGLQGELGPEAGKRLLRETGAKLIALGPVTAAAIEALGLTVDAVAAAHTDAAMVEAVSHALAR